MLGLARSRASQAASHRQLCLSQWHLTAPGSSRSCASTHAFKPEKPTLFDVSLSPFGARVRYIMYAHQLEDRVERKSPKELGGGLKSPEYTALHPAGKMPLLVLPGGQGIPESTVIQDYLLDSMAPKSHLRPTTPELRAEAAAIARYMDLYYAPVAGSMYRSMDIATRAQQISEINAVLDTAELMCKGPYLVGESVSTADAALMPHFVFMTEFLPRYFGWPDVFYDRPKLKAWWQLMQDDEHAARVIEEMRDGVEKSWHSKGRWDELGITEQMKDTSYKWAYP